MQYSTIVLLGDVGVGKSCLVEKITGLRGLSSASCHSYTKCCRPYVNSRLGVQIIDTPGANPLADKLQHNVWIAHALNYAPVSLILIVVKADTRIDNCIDSVRKYAETFQDLSDLLGVCVTHMDTVGWLRNQFAVCLRAELGFETVMSVGKHTAGATALMGMLAMRTASHDVTITSDNFLKFFKISNSNVKILKHIRDEVVRFQAMTRQFFEYMHSQSDQDKVDLVFEFQAFMKEELYSAQKRVAASCSFSFIGADVANEAGHIANMTNQLRSVLLEVRTLALGYQNSAGVSDLRRCPHCGTIWAKIEGCDGETTCGNRVKKIDGRYSTLANYSFNYIGRELRISKLGSRSVRIRASDLSGVGCGRTITWSGMAPAPVPSEFRSSQVATVDDVALLPGEAQQSWATAYMGAESAVGKMEAVVF